MLFTVERFRGGLPNFLAESSKKITAWQRATIVAIEITLLYKFLGVRRIKNRAYFREKYIYIGNLKRFYFYLFELP